MDRLEYLRQVAQEAQDAITAIHEAANADGEARSLTEAEDADFDYLVNVRNACIAEGIQLEKRAAALAVEIPKVEREAGEDRGAPAFHRDADPFSDEYRAQHGDREAAKRAIGELRASASAKEAMQAKLDISDSPELRGFDRHVLAFSSPAYQRAFGKASLGREWDFTAEEAAAWQAGQSQARAMGLTDNAGGYIIPTHLDPSVILTQSTTLNPFRQISRVVSITGDNWNGVTSAGITLAWGTEFAVAGDVTPTFAKPGITPVKASGVVPISIEGYEDIAGAGAEVAREFMQAKDNLEGAAFATGTGSNQPTGIVTALAEGTRQTTMATNSAFVVADLFKAQQHLTEPWRSRASWVMNNGYEQRVRQFGGTDYFSRTVTLDDVASNSLLGRPVYQAGGMTEALNTTTNHAIVLGDFGDNYVIVDRIGSVVEFIPHLFDPTSGRPNGSRGWYVHFRVGADSVNDSAFTLLANPNTAFV